MKPKVFIGSSVENLEIANTLQINLEYDGNITVWNQGVFNLSSNALSDLLNALDAYDFAIFVFQPDDITEMRNNRVQTVRDNIIFELGLFIGKLGKDRVFYLIPRVTNNLHLPTDLIGVSPGTYDNERTDGNLIAALGPFCQQIRSKLKSFISENLTGLQNESVNAKKIVAERKEYWEIKLAVELLRSKLPAINESLYQIESDRIIQRMRSVSIKELYKFIKDTFPTFISLSEQLKKALNDLKPAFGLNGEHGNPLAIKNAIERMIQICNEVITWEYELQSLDMPIGLTEVKHLMQDYPKTLIHTVNELPDQIEKFLNTYIKTGESFPINLKLDVHDGIDKATAIFIDYVKRNNITDLE